MQNFLASQTNLFRDIVEQATEFAIMLLDHEGQIFLWNAGARAMNALMCGVCMCGPL